MPCLSLRVANLSATPIIRLCGIITPCDLCDCSTAHAQGSIQKTNGKFKKENFATLTHIAHNIYKEVDDQSIGLLSTKSAYNERYQ